MASTSKIFVSPGVYTSEKDLTFVTRQVGVTTLGLLGETPKGPAFEPVFISNYDDFTSYFGSLNAEKFKDTGYHKYELNYIAKSFLTQTNQLYVSRVLGHSGYDAGPAWSITLDSAADSSTETEIATTTDGGLTFSATTAGTPVSMTFDNSLLQTLYDNGTISSQFTDIGLLNTGQTKSITSPEYVKSGCDFSGATFDLTVTATGSGGTGFVTGTTTGTVTTYTASCYTELEDSVIATLRSRGDYDGDEQLIFDVTGSTDTEMTDTTSITTDPLATFTISGTSSAGNSFSYSVSLDNTKKNYIESVLGLTPQDGNSELFVGDLYTNCLNDLNDAGKIRGLKTTFVRIPNNLENYQSQWSWAETPWVLSQLQGTNLKRLFKFRTISDGDNANKDVKFSIINIKPDNGTFDLLVRNFYDTDENPSIV